MKADNKQFTELSLSQACGVLRRYENRQGMTDDQILDDLFAGDVNSPWLLLTEIRQILVFIRLYELDWRPTLDFDFAVEQSLSMEPSTIREWIFPATTNHLMAITVVDGLKFEGSRDNAITGWDAGRVIMRWFPQMRSAIEAEYPLISFTQLLPDNPPESFRLLLEALEGQKLELPETQS